MSRHCRSIIEVGEQVLPITSRVRETACSWQQPERGSLVVLPEMFATRFQHERRGDR
jgi:hypothetical protein